MVPDVVWSLPGKSLMSAEARGVDAVLKRTQILRSFGVSIAIENGRILNEHLTSVLLLDGGKIQRVKPYISDVEMLNAFFK